MNIIEFDRWKPSVDDPRKLEYAGQVSSINAGLSAILIIKYLAADEIRFLSGGCQDLPYSLSLEGTGWL